MLTRDTDFNNPQGALLGVINAAFSIGAVISLPIVPYINDRVGRKHSITIGSVILTIGVVLQTASVNGMPSAPYSQSNKRLTRRSCHVPGLKDSSRDGNSLLYLRCLPTHRRTGIPHRGRRAKRSLQRVLGMSHPPTPASPANISKYVGAIIAAGTTLGTVSIPNDWSWRIPSVVQIAPSLLQLTFIWFVPESPRWLLSKDRDEEAFEILVKYHAEGDREDPFVNAEFVEIQTQVRREIENSQRKWVELIQTPGNRKRTLIAACVGLFSQWSGNGLVSYYLAKVLLTVNIRDKRTQNIINLALTVRPSPFLPWQESRVLTTPSAGT